MILDYDNPFFYDPSNTAADPENEQPAFKIMLLKIHALTNGIIFKKYYTMEAEQQKHLKEKYKLEEYYYNEEGVYKNNMNLGRTEFYKFPYDYGMDQEVKYSIQNGVFHRDHMYFANSGFF